MVLSELNVLYFVDHKNYTDRGFYLCSFVLLLHLLFHVLKYRYFTNVDIFVLIVDIDVKYYVNECKRIYS